MSSGFVSGGTADKPIERSDEWLAAQKELEANRAQKAAAAKLPDGRSLYETLEANKGTSYRQLSWGALNETAAKQEAFEEANRLKNQFRALDQDEVDFLDSVLESTRKEEDRVRRETAEGLEHFRKQQEEADKKARIGEDQGTNEISAITEEEQWIAGGRKRKRAKEKEGLKGVKVRKSSSAGEAGSASSPSGKKQDEEPKSTSTAQEKFSEPKDKTTTTIPDSKGPPASSPKPKTGLSLVDYDSDEDDD